MFDDVSSPGLPARGADYREYAVFGVESTPLETNTRGILEHNTRGILEHNTRGILEHNTRGILEHNTQGILEHNTQDITTLILAAKPLCRLVIV